MFECQQLQFPNSRIHVFSPENNNFLLPSISIPLTRIPSSISPLVGEAEESELGMDPSNTCRPWPDEWFTLTIGDNFSPGPMRCLFLLLYYADGELYIKKVKLSFPGYFYSIIYLSSILCAHQEVPLCFPGLYLETRRNKNAELAGEGKHLIT